MTVVINPAAANPAMSMLPTGWLTRLKWLLLANVAGSVLHYVHNILFFEQYPEPTWINRSLIDAFWFVMTPLAWLGYRLLQHGRIHAGTWVLTGYAACSLLTLGHYHYAPMHAIAPSIHLFILLEAALALALLVYLFLPRPHTVSS